MVKKVISGGQSGSDKAGLVAAHDLGIITGGTAPQGWRICLFDGSDGSDPELGSKYGLVEHESYDYPPRTIKNVQDSDGTVWFGFADSPGGKLTINTAAKYNKPYIINPSSEQLRNWCEENNIETLNVAGNRFSQFNPNIFEETYQTLIAAFTPIPI